VTRTNNRDFIDQLCGLDRATARSRMIKAAIDKLARRRERSATRQKAEASGLEYTDASSDDGCDFDDDSDNSEPESDEEDNEETLPLSPDEHHVISRSGKNPVYLHLIDRNGDPAAEVLVFPICSST
jgi:hypothetical protein